MIYALKERYEEFRFLETKEGEALAYVDVLSGDDDMTDESVEDVYKRQPLCSRTRDSGRTDGRPDCERQPGLGYRPAGVQFVSGEDQANDGGNAGGD